MHDPCWLELVDTVRVAVPAVAPAMFTGVVDPKLSVGRFAAPVGLALIMAVNATGPVKPFKGVTVMVEAFPAFAPEFIVSDVPVIAKFPIGAVTTVTLFDPVAELYIPELDESGV